MIISCIVAYSKQRAIGKDNDIPWYLPADLKYFKKTTLNHHIVMGRKCFESIGRPLPKRTNVVLSRNPFYIVSNCLVCRSVEEALAVAHKHGEEEVFIIGGGKIYEQTKGLWDKLYITEVDVDIPDADVFFPELDASEWQTIHEQAHLSDDKNPHNYCFKILERQ